MKQWIIYALCLCLLLCGCSSAVTPETTQAAATQQAQSSEEATWPTEPIETIPAMVYSKPLTAISMIPYSEASRHKSGATLYRWSSQNVTLITNDHAVAKEVSSDINKKNDALLRAAMEDLTAANTDYTGQGDWIPYFCDISYTPHRMDQMVLSLAGHELLYDGTHRSGASVFAFNYDMQTGASLVLRDILYPDYSADQMIAAILDALSKKADSLFEDYADSIAAMFASNAPVENWYFTRNGLCFFFNPYDIAPQSRGVILAEVPYTNLLGILKDAYFPSESVEYIGTLNMGDFHNMSSEEIALYVEAVVDESGSRYLLRPQGTVQNIRIEIGNWTKDGTFSSEYMVFFAEGLTAETAIMLQILPEHLGKLCITYETGSAVMQTPWQSR